ncbi:AraC family transcriptional regulator [Paenibacillus sp. CMAA1364]
MSFYLEIPELDKDLSFRSFVDLGTALCYPHWHKEIEIIYVTKGSFDIGINDVPIRMLKGEIQFIIGGDVHYFLASPDSERIVIQFDLSLYHEISMHQDKTRSSGEAFMGMEHSSSKWSAYTTERMRSLIESIHDENVQSKEGYRYMIKAKLYEMLALIYRDVPRNSQQKNIEFSINGNIRSRDMLEKLERIFSYVEDHYREPITLKEIAEYMGFDSFYFSKMFKKNTGKNFTTFLNDYRLNKAKWLLLTGDEPMIEVAEASGFGSVKTFHHLFKEATGISPLKYRKTLAGKI